MVSATLRKGLHLSLRREERDLKNHGVQRIPFIDERSEVQRNRHMVSPIIPNYLGLSGDGAFSFIPKRPLAKKVVSYSVTTIPEILSVRLSGH